MVSPSDGRVRAIEPLGSRYSLSFLLVSSIVLAGASLLHRDRTSPSSRLHGIAPAVAAPTGGREDTSADKSECQTMKDCSRVSDVCSTSDGCCLCEINPTCAASCKWYCVQPALNPVACPRSVPDPSSHCLSQHDLGLRCTYCLAGTPAVRVCGRRGWQTDRVARCR